MVTTRIICGSTHGAWDDYGANCSICTPTRAVGVDPRDAEIAALKAEVARRDRALAAGPAALRRFGLDGYELAAFDVEAAQAAAMKEGT